MLYLDNGDGTFELWTGWPIGDVLYPLNIEALWSADDLAALDLYQPVDPGIPADKVSTGSSVQRVDGVVAIVYVLVDRTVDPTEVDAERDRRIALPLDVTVPTGPTTITINMNGESLRNIQGLVSWATLQKIASGTDTVSFILYDNSTMDWNADDFIAIGTAV